MNSVTTNGASLGRCYRTSHAAFPGWMTGAFSTASFGCCAQAHHGAICQTDTVPIRLATTASFIQTVDRKFNPRYYGVIEKFGELTGVPVILNTSFNRQEPIVQRPEEAISCYLRTGMDVLVLGDFYTTDRKRNHLHWR